MSNRLEYFDALQTEKQNGRVFYWDNITFEDLKKLSWDLELMDSQIGTLYDVERDVVYRKRARWKLQHRYRMAEKAKQTFAAHGYPDMEEFERIVDQVTKLDEERLSEEARNRQRKMMGLI